MYTLPEWLFEPVGDSAKRIKDGMFLTLSCGRYTLNCCLVKVTQPPVLESENWPFDIGVAYTVIVRPMSAYYDFYEAAQIRADVRDWERNALTNFIRWRYSV